MCGRFTLRTSPQALASHFQLALVPDFEPRYNIAPTQPVAVVRADSQGRRLDLLQWGLVPSWAEDPTIAHRLINARSETAADKPSFRTALRRRRCLIPSDGFYEWTRNGPKKQPYYIAPSRNEPLALAGLWDHWSRGGDTIDSCTILTTEANDLVRPLHDRMPVIIAPTDFHRWLDPSVDQCEQILDLLRPCPSAALSARPVSRWVNSPAHEGPRCLDPPSPDDA